MSSHPVEIRVRIGLQYPYMLQITKRGGPSDKTIKHRHLMGCDKNQTS